MFETESKPHIQQFKFDIEGGSKDYTNETIRKWEWKFYKKCWVEGRWWPSWLSFKQSYLNTFQRLLTSSTKKISSNIRLNIFFNILKILQHVPYHKPQHLPTNGLWFQNKAVFPLEKLAGYALGLERLNVLWLDCFRCLFLSRSHTRAHHVQSEPGSAK